MPASIRLPRILLTNDDGIDAYGLAVLADIAKEFAEEVWIVAPASDQSGMAQSVTLCAPILFDKCGERRWAVKGTPADCVTLALGHFMAEAKPNLILSGVNAGLNEGDALNSSGTAGAALQGLQLGVPSICISQERPPYSPDGQAETPWETSRAVLPPLLAHLLSEGWRKETCLSVNIPNAKPEKVTGFCWARQTRKNIPAIAVKAATGPHGETYAWLDPHRVQLPADEPADSESAILARGKISVTALGLDRSVEVLKPALHFNKPAPEKL